jgi:hypothetical protein
MGLSSYFQQAVEMEMEEKQVRGATEIKLCDVRHLIYSE